MSGHHPTDRIAAVAAAVRNVVTAAVVRWPDLVYRQLMSYEPDPDLCTAADISAGLRSETQVVPAADNIDIPLAADGSVPSDEELLLRRNCVSAHALVIVRQAAEARMMFTAPSNQLREVLVAYARTLPAQTDTAVLAALPLLLALGVQPAALALDPARLPATDWMHYVRDAFCPTRVHATATVFALVGMKVAMTAGVAPPASA